MLLEYSCTNYKSIKEKILFSMLASKDNSYEEELKDYNGLRILRTSAIYGANGSGKSSFIESFGFLQALIVESINLQPGDKILRTPHKLSGKDEPTSYTVQFICNNTRYVYSVSILEEKITEEYLYYFPNGKQAKIFDRDLEEISINEKFKKDLETCKNILKPNRLFLSCAANFSNVEEIVSVFLFFKEKIVIYQNGPNNWLNYSAKTLQDNEEVKDVFIKFMKYIGTGLEDIKVKYNRKKLDSKELPIQMPEPLKNILTAQETEIIDVKLDYGKFLVNLKEESQGIQKLFEILCPIVDILANGKILICDEIETSLHANIVLEIIKLFKYLERKEVSQLIFSTHDTSLLDLSLFRRDQIWFTELKPELRSTDLYSLAELKNVRKDENVLKGYISGKYGAIPMLNKDIANIFN